MRDQSSRWRWQERILEISIGVTFSGSSIGVVMVIKQLGSSSDGFQFGLKVNNEHWSLDYRWQCNHYHHYDWWNHVSWWANYWSSRRHRPIVRSIIRSRQPTTATCLFKSCELIPCLVTLILITEITLNGVRSATSPTVTVNESGSKSSFSL